MFTIKDASTNFLTLSQSTGQVNILKALRLENTTSSNHGVVYKGADRFLHNFGNNNTFLGNNSGNFTLVEANSNTGVGQFSLNALSTGDYNTALGNNTLVYNTTGSRNVAVGLQALYHNSSGNSNTALGTLSLNNNSTGERNTSVGESSLTNNTSGNYNTAIGYSSLNANAVGDQNTAVGFGAMNFNYSGNYNTALGLNSLFSNTSGDQNTALGFSSGSAIVTGNNLTLIGYNSQPSSASANNQITLGNSSVTSLRSNVQTITSLSDMRDKKNIKDLSLGLDFLMKIKPRLFNWDKREWYEDNVSDGSKLQEVPTAGFIAQELDEVQTTENAEWMNLVLKDNPEKLEATSGNLLPVMVKAIQELKVENEKLKVENVQLKNELESLKLMNEKIVKLEKIVNELTSVKYISLGKENENKTITNEGDEK